MSTHMVDGVSTVICPNQSTKTLDLCLHKWELARANTTAYLSPSKSPPHAALPQIRRKMKESKSVAGRPHRAKGFADNMSAISANKTDHQSTLDTIQQHSASLDLILKPPKCLSYCFSGKFSVPDLCFIPQTGPAHSGANCRVIL